MEQLSGVGVEGRQAAERTRSLAELGASERAGSACLAAPAWLWLGLTRGVIEVVDHFNAEDCSHVVVRARRAPTPRAGLTPRNIEILRRLVRGEAQKTVALELGLAPSTVASHAASCLTAMGFRCRTQSVPLLLAISLRATEQRVSGPTLRGTSLRNAWGVCTVLSASAITCGLGNELSQAERAVVSSVLDGCSNDEIARVRGTSERTVANQLGSAFQKLGVGCRSGLIWRWACWYVELSSGARLGPTSIVLDPQSSAGFSLTPGFGDAADAQEPATVAELKAANPASAHELFDSVSPSAAARDANGALGVHARGREFENVAR